MARLLVVHHSPSQSTQSLRDAVLAGAQDPDIEGVDDANLVPDWVPANIALPTENWRCIGLPRYFSEQAELAGRMKAGGESVRTIAATLSVSRATVYRVVSAAE